MRLSVVMAVRDEQLYVADAIESVLAQTFGEFELIIVDDGSRDATPEILREYQRRDPRIRLLRNAAPLGPYPSANRGIAEARGCLIARHDGDDVSPPDRLALQIEIAESDRAITLVTGAVESFGNGERAQTRRPPIWQPRLEWELFFRNIVGAGAHVMFPRVVGGSPVRFPERYPYAEDYRLWCTLSRFGRVVCPDTIVYRHRQHPLSITHSRRAEQVGCFTAMRQEYQGEYLEHAPAHDLSVGLSHYWRSLAGHTSSSAPDDVVIAFGALRQRFLEYVLERWGGETGRQLDADIDRVLHERNGRHAEPGLLWRTGRRQGLSRRLPAAGVLRTASGVFSRLRSRVRPPIGRD